MCAHLCVSGRVADFRAQICSQGERWRDIQRSQTPRETSLISQPPPALPWAQDTFLFRGSLGFVHRKPCDDWLPHWLFHVGVEVARRGGQRSAGPGPRCSQDELCSQRFALLQIHLEGIPNSMPFSPFGLKKGSKSQTGSISLHLSCSVSLSDR